MRALYKSWSDQKPFTRRVQWFEGGPESTIRLCFEDHDAHINAFFTDRKRAQAAYDRFVAGTSAMQSSHAV